MLRLRLCAPPLARVPLLLHLAIPSQVPPRMLLIGVGAGLVMRVAEGWQAMSFGKKAMEGTDQKVLVAYALEFPA